MWAFTLRRLIYAVPVLLGVSMLVFVLIHLAPGDVVDILVPPEVPKEIADSLRRRFRLDEPIYLQYLAWLGRLMVGDFGISFLPGPPVGGGIVWCPRQYARDRPAGRAVGLLARYRARCAGRL